MDGGLVVGLKTISLNGRLAKRRTWVAETMTFVQGTAVGIRPVRFELAPDQPPHWIPRLAQICGALTLTVQSRGWADNRN